jgi:hypothetical protein
MYDGYGYLKLYTCTCIYAWPDKIGVCNFSTVKKLRRVFVEVTDQKNVACGAKA